MNTAMKQLMTIVFFGIFLLSACNYPGVAPATQDSPDFIYTAAAQTVAARTTQSTPLFPTSVQQTQPPTNQPGGVQPTATQAVIVQPTATQFVVLPTATSNPPTQVPTPCDRASFVKDVSFPDGTEVAAGATFVKTWRLKNTGTCTWNSSYSLVFAGGDSMGGPAAVQLTTGTVAPDQEIDVSVTLKAPDTPKEYTGNWKLRNANNSVFGVGSNAQSAFWVKIEVVNPLTPTPTVTSTPPASIVYDFIDRASSAEWRNATALLPWGDPPTDTAGVATILEDVRLNDGKTYDEALATYPQRVENGIITGLFSGYVVQNGDHFTARLGFRSGCGNGRVEFQLNYVVSGGPVTALREWSKACDNKLLEVDVDLSSLKGQTVSFMLAVSADGPMDDDFALWVDPRIQR